MSEAQCPHCHSPNIRFLRLGKTAPAKDGGTWVTKRFQCYDCKRFHWESRKVMNDKL